MMQQRTFQKCWQRSTRQLSSIAAARARANCTQPCASEAGLRWGLRHGGCTTAPYWYSEPAQEVANGMRMDL